jgi:hypothetical protein
MGCRLEVDDDGILPRITQGPEVETTMCSRAGLEAVQ